MPPEQDDVRARQLEALRRYVAELGVQRDGPAVETAQPQPASERQRRPSRPWLLLTGLLVVVALVGGLVGAVAWSDDRPTGGTGSAAVASGTPPPTVTTAGVLASAACKTAVDRATRCSPPP